MKLKKKTTKKAKKISKLALSKKSRSKSAPKTTPVLKITPISARPHKSNVSNLPVNKGISRKRRVVGSLLGWGLVIVLVMGFLSVLSDYSKSAEPVSKLSANKLPQVSLLNVFDDESDPVVLAVGDISLARYIEKKMRGNKDYTLPFTNVAEFTKAADITVGAFNNPLLAGKNTPEDSYFFRADPSSVQGLIFAGFDLLSLANNQVMNYHSDGLLNTLNILHKANVKTIGAGDNAENAHAPAVFDVKGKKIAFYSYADPAISPNRKDGAGEKTAGIALMDIDAMKTDVKNALKSADYVIVMMHSGVEYKHEPSQLQKDFAHAAIDAGASVVIGTHPHVVQPVEHYMDGVIFYSLGNFVFDQFFSEDVRTGLAVKMKFSGAKGQAPEVELFPVRLDTYQPWIPEGEKANEFLKKMGVQ